MDPSTEYASIMTKETKDLTPKQKAHKFNVMKKQRAKAPSKRKKGSKGTGSYFGKASKRGRAYLKDLDEAGKI